MSDKIILTGEAFIIQNEPAAVSIQIFDFLNQTFPGYTKLIPLLQEQRLRDIIYKWIKTNMT